MRLKKSRQAMWLTSYIIRIALFFVVALIIVVGLLVLVKGVKTGGLLRFFS